ncbi:class II fructose-1,6-bisphosphate aldolase [Bacillus safensis]|uniref:class II fructose-1,6-bisphosphate aldolase n=1 Tax=Bacillus TaxID=1386 RepID=UPI000F767EA1|nr:MULTISPECIES: class II fructose-1,6-bisphosphate aldolase [Bacillus]MCM3368137.1 class II fructose-1,6-bisphosphate aldolase [Bacillus safensis]MDJ0291770.1 class II fructose-1,6-bisphosphate aldolase [Bacillus safensis]MED1459179.1 class II fructose-1,6-bisphosphate aldolase [Bacillus safensis]NMW02876.1 class II fructose-1,6-bisphosphate aldolase [Bacillus safensis]
MTVIDSKLISMKSILHEAKQKQYAVGQININGLQWVKAILLAAKEERSPIILAASDRLIDYLGGFHTIVGMVEGLMRDLEISVPVSLHLDHGMTVSRCKAAIDAGFSSVMIDGSSYPLSQNITMTKEVVHYASKRGVSVEAEVGSVGGMEDGLIGNIIYADPYECVRLVRETGIDALAAALGSVHGSYQGEPRLGFDEMKQIAELTDVPLVLHGGSGIPVDQIQRAISLGHAKINVNTECLEAWNQAVRAQLTKNKATNDPQTILTPGTEAIKQVVKMKIQQFGSSQRV